MAAALQVPADFSACNCADMRLFNVANPMLYVAFLMTITGKYMLPRVVFNSFSRKVAIFFMLQAIAIFNVFATESPPTLVLVGHKPSVSHIVLDPAKPSVGDTVTVSWQYSDIEKLPEGNSIVSWVIAGNEVKVGTDKSYTLPHDSAGKTLEVVVQPVASPPSFPSQGYKKGSDRIVIGAFTYEGRKYIVPTNNLVTQAEAVAACEKLNKTLPWPYELHYMFKELAEKNKKPLRGYACEGYGWPLKDKCGGTSNYYWGAVEPGKTMYRVNLGEGKGTIASGKDELGHYACY